MSRSKADPALAALALLRDEPLPSQWDRVLESRLLAHYPRSRVRLRRRLAFGLLVFAFASAACAVGPWQALSRWWYSLQVDGRELRGDLVNGEPAKIWLSESGDSVEVRVAHESAGTGGERTQWDVAWDSPTHEAEQSIVVEQLTTAPSDLAVSCIDGELPLHVWLDENGREWALFLLRESPQKETGALYVLEPEGSALQLAGCGPAWLFDSNASFEFTELPPLALNLGATHPSGEVWRLVLTAESTPHGSPQQLRSPDGRFCLRLGRIPTAAAKH